jgi:hypothetical protein
MEINAKRSHLEDLQARLVSSLRYIHGVFNKAGVIPLPQIHGGDQIQQDQLLPPPQHILDSKNTNMLCTRTFQHEQALTILEEGKGRRRRRRRRGGSYLLEAAVGVGKGVMLEI